MFSDRYQIAVARKQLDGINQQGQNALALIQTATAPAVAAGASVGSRLSVYA
ncbi:MAG: hypothetical protein MUF34_18375 [Polyangiaceae bacterium]|jgi:hypothetical protein|nr:hypothetical protein [Polyangiaceae bacterium]